MKYTDEECDLAAKLSLELLTPTEAMSLIRAHTQKAVAPLVEALTGSTRIVEAMRYSTGLGRNQIERLAKAKELIAAYKTNNGSAGDAE
jgi:hypothetical protein